MSSHIDSQPRTLIWLDQTPTHSDEYTYIRQELLQVDEQLKIFSCADDCETHIKNQSTDAGITLIVSGTLGKYLVPKIHDLSQIKEIYVYCRIKAMHEGWTTNRNKVQGIYITFSELYQRLRPNHITSAAVSGSASAENTNTDVPPTTALSTTNELPSETTAVGASEGEAPTASATQTEEAVPAPSQPQPVSIPRAYQLDIEYHISESCFDCIFRIQWPSQDIQDFVALCQGTFQGDEEALSIVRELSQDYAAEKSMSYLYRHPYFCGLLDEIFYMTIIDAMVISRVFLHDICKQFTKHKCTSSVQVYRGEVMSNTQFRQLEEMKGKIIAMKGFCATNAKRETALSNTPAPASTSESKRVLYTINADPQVKNSKAFVKISSLGDYDDPNGVVFLIGSLFKVTEIEDEKDGIINVKLTLCAIDEDDSIKMFFDQIKQKCSINNGEMDAVSLGQFLHEVGKAVSNVEISGHGEKLIRNYHDKLDPNHLDHSRCCLILGDIEHVKRDTDAALVWYEKAIEMRRKKPSENDLDLIAALYVVASIYCDKGALEKALEAYNAVLKIRKESTSDDDLNLIPCYSDLAMVHKALNKPIDAFSCLFQAERIAMKHNATNDSTFATLCSNMGTIRAELHQYHLALGYYHTSLEIRLSFLAPTDRSIASLYQSLGYVYGHINDVAQSKSMYEKAVEIYRQIQPVDNSTVTVIEECIRNLSTEKT